MVDVGANDTIRMAALRFVSFKFSKRALMVLDRDRNTKNSLPRTNLSLGSDSPSQAQEVFDSNLYSGLKNSTHYGYNDKNPRVGALRDKNLVFSVQGSYDSLA